MNMQVKRQKYLNQLINTKGIGMIKIVTGIRRCGKSYLLFNLFVDHLKSTGVRDDHIIQIDLENRRNFALRDPDELIRYIDSQMVDNDQYYILLDEVQNVREFEDVLNSYLKIDNADVYVTGSNSRFLSSDVITEFRGRGLEIRIFPLSFSEFYSVYDGSRENALSEYLLFGGMPELLKLKTDALKADYLRNLFAKTYLTDIRARYKIGNDTYLSELVDILASSIGGLINPTKIINTFKSLRNSSISNKTIKKYLDIMEDAFLIEKSVRFDVKGRKYIATPAKYYFADLGLRNARLNFRQKEPTHLMENLIYNELRIRGNRVDVGVVVANSKDANGVSFRKQLEVDFVCNKACERLYIQSALRLPTEEKRQQELRSLNNIHDNFRKIVITEDPIRLYQDLNGVSYINLYDFLLNENSI